MQRGFTQNESSNLYHQAKLAIDKIINFLYRDNNWPFLIPFFLAAPEEAASLTVSFLIIVRHVNKKLEAQEEQENKNSTAEILRSISSINGPEIKKNLLNRLTTPPVVSPTNAPIGNLRELFQTFDSALQTEEKYLARRSYQRLSNEFYRFAKKALNEIFYFTNDKYGLVMLGSLFLTSPTLALGLIAGFILFAHHVNTTIKAEEDDRKSILTEISNPPLFSFVRR